MRTSPECRGRSGFTLVEMLVVIAIILILAGLILSTAGYIQKKGASSRAEAEIAAISAALESYKVDNGIYPTNPVSSASGNGSIELYKALTGDTNDDGTAESALKAYMDIKPAMISTNGGRHLIDPYGVSYNYWSPGTNNPATFDLWSTAGASTNVSSSAKWIKNW